MNEAYVEYLKSERWANVRAAALRRAKGRCQACNSPDFLDAHHRTYERMGREDIADITVLCRECHGTFHDRLAIFGVRTSPGFSSIGEILRPMLLAGWLSMRSHE